MNPVLTGKTAIITHVSSEFAISAARAAGGCGATLVLVDNDLAALEHAQKVLRNDGLSSAGFVCRSTDDIDKALVEIESQMASAQILILCPPDHAFQPSSLLDIDAIRHLMDEAFLYLCGWAVAAGRHMLADGGQIVFVNGLSYMGGWRGWGAASAAFGALHALSQTLAVEWAGMGVRVNTLVPGVTERIALAISGASEDVTLDDVRSRIPQRQLLDPSRLGYALLYLLSPSSSYITGETLRVDGGWSSWGRLHSQAK